MPESGYGQGYRAALAEALRVASGESSATRIVERLRAHESTLWAGEQGLKDALQCAHPNAGKPFGTETTWCPDCGAIKFGGEPADLALGEADWLSPRCAPRQAATPAPVEGETDEEEGRALYEKAPAMQQDDRWDLIAAYKRKAWIETYRFVRDRVLAGRLAEWGLEAQIIEEKATIARLEATLKATPFGKQLNDVIAALFGPGEIAMPYMPAEGVRRLKGELEAWRPVVAAACAAVAEQERGYAAREHGDVITHRAFDMVKCAVVALAPEHRPRAEKKRDG